MVVSTKSEHRERPVRVVRLKDRSDSTESSFVLIVGTHEVKTAGACRCSIRSCVVNGRDEGNLPAGSEVVYEGRKATSGFPALKIKARAFLSLPDSLISHLIDRDRHFVDHRSAYPGAEPDRLVEV